MKTHIERGEKSVILNERTVKNLTKEEIVEAITNFAKMRAEEVVGNTLDERDMEHIKSSAKRALQQVIDLAIELAKQPEIVVREEENA